MRYWLDSEFIDDGKTIDLISIGIVAEDGREYYAQSVEFDDLSANDWVKAHVLPHLSLCPEMPQKGGRAPSVLATQMNDHGGLGPYFKARKHLSKEATLHCPWRTRNHLAHELFTFLDVKVHGTPELWGWCAAYDFVALCQIFGTMLDLPAGWPHYIRELQYLLDERGITDSELPATEGTAHNALADAKQIKTIWEMVQPGSMDRQAWQAYKEIEPRYSEANRRLAEEPGAFSDNGTICSTDEVPLDLIESAQRILQSYGDISSTEIIRRELAKVGIGDYMTTAEMAQQIILWIRKMHTENNDHISETAMQDRVFALVDNIEALCKEQLASVPPPKSKGVVHSFDQPGIPGLTEGRICHYTDYNGRCLAALVIGHTATRADLAVFTNLENVNGVKNFGMQFHPDIEYSEEPRPGTWHWIEKA